jgi:hypothetical protein
VSYTNEGIIESEITLFATYYVALSSLLAGVNILTIIFTQSILVEISLGIIFLSVTIITFVIVVIKVSLHISIASATDITLRTVPILAYFISTPLIV